MYIGFGANDSTHYLYITHSSDGVNFTAATQYPQALVGSSPALVVNQNILSIYCRNVNDGTIYSISSTDGVNFTPPLQLLNGNSGPFYTSTSVSAVSFGGNSNCIAYADDYGAVQVIENTAEYADSSVNQVAPSGTTSNAPSITYFNGNLIVAYQQLANHALVVSSSIDSWNWPTGTVCPGILIGGSPSVSVYNGSELLVAFKSNDSHNVFFTTSGYTASTLASPANGYYPGDLIGSAPALVATPGLPYSMYAAFKSNDSNNVLFTTGSK
ncbi:MAG: hypothetical protein P4K80_07770 [Acidobacteriaceae bacterium]|nr:hypothetical protein [Acidobacteriaceae bacterium]